MAVSLGTSDTIMGITSQPSPQEEVSCHLVVRRAGVVGVVDVGGRVGGEWVVGVSNFSFSGVNGSCPYALSNLKLPRRSPLWRGGGGLSEERSCICCLASVGRLSKHKGSP